MIVFETHATSLDNEAGIASGWFDIGLSARGEREAAKLGRRYRQETAASASCSDLPRAPGTVRVAFGGRGVPVVHDPRRRACDHGARTRQPVAVIDCERPNRVAVPFTKGERAAAWAARSGSGRWRNRVPLAQAVAAPGVDSSARPATWPRLG